MSTCVDVVFEIYFVITAYAPLSPLCSQACSQSFLGLIVASCRARCGAIWIFAVEEAQLKIEHFWAGSLKNAVIDGDVENGSLMAGQSVSMVKKIQSVKEIFNELIAQANSQIITEKGKL